MAVTKSTNLSLVGKYAIVTGSARQSGIGQGIARTLAQNGANVAIHHMSPSSAASAEKIAVEIASEFGVKAVVVQGAIDVPENTDKIVLEALKGFGSDHIDILVNNAGFGDQQPLMTARPENFEAQFSVNVFGLTYLVQSVVQLGKMPRGGRIINIGTIASKQGLANLSIYSAAKAAQDSLTASWAGVLGKSHGITVNTIAPGPVKTELAKPILEEADGSPTPFARELQSQTRAADRVGTTDDIADAVLLLSLEQSRWITAQWISASGGITGTM